MHKWLRSYRGGRRQGPVNPAGDRLWYQINGLQAWAISHLCFFAGAFWFKWFSPTIIFDHWAGLLFAANILGWALAFVIYAKAYSALRLLMCRKFSGNLLYDFYMGIELNPLADPSILSSFLMVVLELWRGP